MKFDPMTGEPINEETPVTPESVETVANPAMESVKSAISSMSTKKWFLPALIGGGVGVVAIIAAVAVFVSGAFLAPAQKVALAAGNTFKDAGVIGDVLTATLTASASDKSTTRFMFGMEEGSVDVEYRHTKGDKQIWMNMDISGYPEIEGTATLTKKELQVSAPLLGDYVYFYDYTTEPEGYVFEQIDEDIVEAFNKALTQLYTGQVDDSEALKEMTEKLQEWMEEIEIEEVDKDEFEINGRDVSCAGYEIVIDEKTMLEYVEIICDGTVEYMEELGYDEIEGFDTSVYDNLYEEMADEIEGMPEVTFTVYMDSNLLAAIIVEVEDEEEELEILFEGGDYRAQNITVKFDDEKVFALKGEKDGNEESLRLVVYVQEYDGAVNTGGVNAITLFEYEYDKKSGDFEAAILDSYGDALLEIEGTIICNNNGVEITDGEISDAYSDEKIEFEFSCKKGATIEKMDGERFDIGNADEDEFQDLYEDIQDELEDFIYTDDYYDYY